MTDWREVVDGGFEVPGGQLSDEVVAELSEALRSPDPVLRDDQAYVILARWIPDMDSGQRRRLGDAMAARLADPEVQARTFAALALAEIVRNGDFEAPWVAAFAAWYPAEKDLRGHDPELGWLHAVAHGADLLRALADCPQADPAQLLELAAARLLAPTDYVFAQAEDDRLGYAIAKVLIRGDVSEAQSVDWLGPVSAAFGAAEPGPVPPWASNTMRTLRVLYLLADRGVRPGWHDGEPVSLRYRDAVRQRIADILGLVAPYAG